MNHDTRVAISFIVPAYNEEVELPGMLRALRTAAEAAGQPYEIVVADDASTDATAEIAREFGARVTPVNRRQIAATRNAGAAVARGEILFFVDADTHIKPAHVRAALAALERGCVGGSARLALDAQVPLWARAFLAVFSAIYFGLNLGVGAFMFMRRETFAAVGGFDEQYFAGEEMYLTIALKQHGRFVILPEPIVTSARKVRMHSGWSMLWQWFAMMAGGKASLQNRRKLDLWYDGKRERNAT
jgi:glycosyltransferase involved in cell wall biosynthesis